MSAQSAQSAEDAARDIERLNARSSVVLEKSTTTPTSVRTKFTAP
eukprot:gene45471-56641_t